MAQAKAEWEKPISFAAFSRLHYEAKAEAEIKEKNKLKQCMTDFNKILQSNAERMVRRGEKPEDFETDWYLSQYNMVAPSEDVNRLIKMIQETGQWQAVLTPVRRESIQNPGVNIDPVLHITPAKDRPEPHRDATPYD